MKIWTLDSLGPMLISFFNSSPSKVVRQRRLTQVVEVGVHLASASFLFDLAVERRAGAARES